MRLFVVVWRHFHVAGQNFEEIQHLITPQVERKKDPWEKAIRVLVPTYYFSVSPQTWRDLLKFDSTAGSSNHWSTYSASAKAES